MVTTSDDTYPAILNTLLENQTSLYSKVEDLINDTGGINRYTGATYIYHTKQLKLCTPNDIDSIIKQCRKEKYDEFLKLFEILKTNNPMYSSDEYTIEDVNDILVDTNLKNKRAEYKNKIIKDYRNTSRGQTIPDNILNQRLSETMLDIIEQEDKYPLVSLLLPGSSPTSLPENPEKITFSDGKFYPPEKLYSPEIKHCILENLNNVIQTSDYSLIRTLYVYGLNIEVDLVDVGNSFTQLLNTFPHLKSIKFVNFNEKLFWTDLDGTTHTILETVKEKIKEVDFGDKFNKPIYNEQQSVSLFGNSTVKKLLLEKSLIMV